MNQEEQEKKCLYLGSRLQRLRAQHNWSQQELADQVYVTRQTISNWETGKNYPDLQSLLLLSKIFAISLDDLVKGDLEIMRETIKRSDIHSMYVYTYLMIGLIMAAIIAFGLAIHRFGWPGYLLAIVLLFPKK